MPKPTERFTDRADAYAQHRPQYPPGVFDALFEELDARTLTVADIGAGTGISTAALAQRVAHVIAIEPNASMRAKGEAHTNVEWRDGTAEQTGLEAKAVDVAAAFQAFHWFDAAEAFREFVRVSRRRIALVQYERDESQPFSAEYAQTIAPFMIDDTEARRMRALENFAAFAAERLRRREVRFVQTLDANGVSGRIDSSSYLPQEGSQAAELRERARALFDRHAENGAVEMAMIAYVLAVDV